MLATKNRAVCRAIVLTTLVVLLAGCSPPGRRAVLDGKRLLDQGRYEQAVERLNQAVTLLATNAQAWNYLGLACQCAGQTTNAVAAYKRAYALDPDLMEAHYNLGCLWLEQNRAERLDDAKAELTTYTLRRPNAVEGWLKLAAVRLRARDADGAGRDFKQVLNLSPQHPEALNGLGLVSIQRNRPLDATRYFTAALKQRPGYAAALLNLAVVSQRYLNDPAAALQRYREYLALKPSPNDAEAVKAAMQALEPSVALAPGPGPVPDSAPPPAAPAPNTARPPASVTTRVAPPKRESRPAVVAAPATAIPASPSNVEVVRLPPEPMLRMSPPAGESTPAPSGAAAKVVPAPAAPTTVAGSATPSRRGLLQRINPANLFRSGSQVASSPPPPPAKETAIGSEVIARPESGGPGGTTFSAPTHFARYAYLSPTRPAAGDRSGAERALAQGAQARQANRLAEAAQSFRQAVQLDPGYFEAQCSLGQVTLQSANYRQALAAYENALAIRPESADARCDFALALQAAGYPLDAAAELEKVLRVSPNETRAHLALGNLCAGELRDLPRARQHYLKVLELNPHHPQAAPIRFWLNDHPA